MSNSREHGMGWNTTSTAQQADLAEMVAAEVDLAEKQVEALAAMSRTMGIRAYQSLCALYPNHARIEIWKACISELESSK